MLGWMVQEAYAASLTVSGAKLCLVVGVKFQITNIYPLKTTSARYAVLRSLAVHLIGHFRLLVSAA